MTQDLPMAGMMGTAGEGARSRLVTDNLGTVIAQPASPDSKEVTGSEIQTIRALYQRARDYADDEIGPKLERAWRYYDGEVDADPAFFQHIDESGKKVFHGSSTVIRECWDKLRATLPELARVFLSSDEMVAFTPKRQEDEDYAEQATDYCNLLVRSDGGEERVMDTFIAWLVKFAAIKVYWDVEEKQEVKGFSGLNEMALQMLMASVQDPSTDLKEVQAEPEQQMLDDGMGNVQTVVTYKGVTRITRRTRGIKWRLIPHEEFLIDPDAQTEREALMIGQDRYMTVSDVVAMGIPYETAMQHATTSIGTRRNEAVAVARRGRDEDRFLTSDIPDASLRYVRIIEAIVRLDRDQDGIAERYRCVMLGDSAEPVALEPGDDCYYIVASPYRRPWEPIGTGQTENLTDLQDQLTALVRGWINNANRANNPREVVESSDVDAYTTMKSPFGGVVRSQNPGAIGVHVIPFTASQNAPLLQYFQDRSASRTGITLAGQGLDPDALKSGTVDGIKAIVTAPQTQIEFLAREFAAGVLRPMFQAMLQIAKRYQDEPTVVRLRGNWVPVSPADWPEDMDVDIRVGLGGGTKAEKFAVTSGILDRQLMLMQMGSPLVTWEQIQDTLKTMTELAGYKNTGRFFKQLSPDELAQFQQQQAQSAQAQQEAAAQHAVQLESAKSAAAAQARAQADVQKAQVDAQAAQQKAQLDAQTAQHKAETDAGLAREAAVLDLTIQREKQANELLIAREKLASEERLKLAELEMEKEIELLKMHNRSPGGQGNIPQVTN